MWVVRTAFQRAIPCFTAHWTSFADRSSFAGYNAIGRRCLIVCSSFGRFSYVAADTKIARAKIGAFCSIGQEVMIGGLAKHPMNWLSTHPVFFSTKKQANITFVEHDAFREEYDVEIGNDVWVGARAMILDGCRVGNGAVIAAGAVVAKDVPPYAMVGGVPAQVIKFRFSPEEISKLEEMKWWNWDLQALRKFRFGESFK